MNYSMRLRKGASDFKNYVQKVSMTILNENGITSLTKFKHSVLPRKRISHRGFDGNFNPILPGGGGKIRPLLFFLQHPKTAQGIKLTFL